MKLHARIRVDEEILRRFTDFDRLMVENWLWAIADWQRLACDKAEQPEHT